MERGQVMLEAFSTMANQDDMGVDTTAEEADIAAVSHMPAMLDATTLLIDPASFEMKQGHHTSLSW
jgi:hypothetical protein